MDNEQQHQPGGKKFHFFKKIFDALRSIKQYFILGKIKLIFNKKTAVIVACVVVLMICVFGAVGLGAYQLNWDNRLVNALLRIFPYPAAIVDGHIVSFYDWREETKGVLILSKTKFSNVSELAVQQDVLDKLINDVFLRKLAKQFKVKVTPADIDKRIDDIANQLGSRDVLASNVQQLFGWDLPTFIKRVVRSDVLRAKLELVVQNSSALWLEAEKSAQDVLSQLKDGQKTFAELAKEYSADTATAPNGGELGWFPAGVMVKEFEDAAFALKKGETSGLVKTQYGYHIIFLEDKKAGDKKTGATEEVKVSHILITPMTADQHLVQMKANASIHKFVALPQ